MTTNLSGSLSEFSLAEVLSLLGMGGRTARMQVSTPDSVGMVHLVDGEVCAATANSARAGLLRALVAGLPVPADDLARAVHEAQLTAEEEAYAAALWPIHSEVKLAAVRMIFAGLHYKTSDPDAGKLKSKVQPLTGTFLDAARRVDRMRPPASLQDAHDSYQQALVLYTSATREMVRIVEDGKDEHLLLAQKRSEQASLAILKLSDVLWPGEYKPN